MYFFIFHSEFSISEFTRILNPKEEIPPGKLTWNLKIICLKREIIFQTIIDHPFSGSMLIFRGAFMR